MDGCLNEDHVEYVTWILSSEFHTLYKGVEKVLTRLRICRHAFAFNARKCVKYFAVVCRANYIISQKNGYDHEFDK